jgi:hypothetical protein
LLVKICGVNLFHLVSWIVAIAILYFLSSLIVIRRPPGLYSDRTFQVANQKSFLRLLLVFNVLICPIFSSFSFVISVFSVDGELAHRTTSPRRRATYWWSPFNHPVVPLQLAAPLGSDAVCTRSSGDQTLLFSSPSLTARIWDLPAGYNQLHPKTKCYRLTPRGY